MARGIDDRHHETNDTVLALGRLTRGGPTEVAEATDAEDVADALESLARRRVVARIDIPRTYFDLRSLLDG